MILNWEREQHATAHAITGVRGLLGAIEQHLNEGRAATTVSDDWACGDLTAATAGEWQDYSHSAEQLWEQVMALAAARWLDWKRRRVDAASVVKAMATYDNGKPSGLRLVTDTEP